MKLTPKKNLTADEIKTGLRLMIVEGLAAEAMVTLTGGAFLVSLALLMGATNTQIGVLASLPTFTNLFQLLSIWLVRKFNNRRAVAVACGFFARVPLVIVGILPFLVSADNFVSSLIFLLFFYYLFGSVAGPSWNAWIKDMVPSDSLGSYFSRRGSYTQTLNVVLSVALALLLDYVKRQYPGSEVETYAYMFIGAGIVGLLGTLVLAQVQEPQSYLNKENILRMIRKPLQDRNFRKLLIFNSAWVFAINIATPFFTVFMLKTLGIPLSYVIVLTVISQIANILTIRAWGRYSDRYSNKTIIAIGAPLYIVCLIAWCFVGIYTRESANLVLLAAIHIVTGVANAGINLSLTNIGLKLSPSDGAIVYLTTRNIVTSVFSSVAPVVGGALADYFTQRSLIVIATWSGPHLNKLFRLVLLHEWNFLFLIAAFFAFIAVELLLQVKETGEVDKDQVVRIMRSDIRNNLKDQFLIGTMITLPGQLWAALKKRVRRRRSRARHHPSVSTAK
ncbi:MFS transporter [Fulvivirgaceae bacterium PWU5]|uniref:MFS transporter n=1 Tax=Dawidia cretensis TaxID=2782350 RepID=A0AAP2DXW1_9BACT|nr:MFS transporter [Dawidia cretensis]MBT1708168.1 MFS transporter [Dawidia cretensis]